MSVVESSSTVERLEVPQQNLKSVNVKITGTSEHIVHRLSEKAGKMNEDIQGTKTTNRKKRKHANAKEEC